MAKRHRSPSYPALTLTEALEKAQVFYNEEGRHATPVSVAVQHWGYSPKSSGGSAAVAALKAWGLFEDEGSGDSRTVRLSPRALQIIQDTRDDSTERNQLLADAAASPKIIRELNDQFPDGSVSEGNLNFYLVQREYNPNAVSDIIKAYRDALSYINAHQEYEDDDESDGGQDHDQPGGDRKKRRARLGAGMKQDTFTLDEGDVSLTWPSALSEESFSDLKDWFEIMQRKISRSVKVKDAEEEDDET